MFFYASLSAPVLSASRIHLYGTVAHNLSTFSGRRFWHAGSILRTQFSGRCSSEQDLNSLVNPSNSHRNTKLLVRAREVLSDLLSQPAPTEPLLAAKHLDSAAGRFSSTEAEVTSELAIRATSTSTL